MAHGYTEACLATWDGTMVFCFYLALRNSAIDHLWLPDGTKHGSHLRLKCMCVQIDQISSKTEMKPAVELTMLAAPGTFQVTLCKELLPFASVNLEEVQLAEKKI